MSTKIHPSKLPMAPKELSDQLLEDASIFIVDDTGIVDSTVTTLLARGLSEGAVRSIAEFVTYMATFAVAEREANKQGFTIRDWSKAP